MTYKFSWYKNHPFKADAQKCGDEILSLKECTPEAVLDKAKDNSSELHKCFEWDDTIAAEKYRLVQAREVIRFLYKEQTKEEVENKKEPIRIFQISSEKKVYQPIQFFVEHKDEYEILLSRAKGELRSIRNRYENLSELEEVFDAIDRL